MKTFRELISEVAQPKSKDEIDFKAKHEIEMIDHPESEEHQHTSEKKGRKRLADYAKGEDMAVYESYAIYYKGDVFDSGFSTKKEAQDSINGMNLSPSERKNYKIRIDRRSAKDDGRWMKESAEHYDDDVEENAFMGKAAAAKKAGKDKFKLGDKKFPVTIKKDTADKIIDESIELNESNADKMISTLISAISKYSDKREFERAGAVFELWAERFPSAYKKLLSTPGIAGSFFSDLVEVLDIRVDLDESVEDLDEISKKTLQRYKDRATSDFVGRSISDPKLSKRIRGATTADKKIHGGARVRATESTDLTENFKQGSLTLKDGSKVIVSKQNADLLNQMFDELNATNRREMMKVAMEDKDGFNEILGFARETL